MYILEQPHEYSGYSISQALQISDAETCVVSKVAMMSALGAVAQHYIKFPGFDAGWQGRVEVARRSESSRISSRIPAGFLHINKYKYK